MGFSGFEVASILLFSIKKRGPTDARPILFVAISDPLATHRQTCIVLLLPICANAKALIVSLNDLAWTLPETLVFDNFKG